MFSDLANHICLLYKKSIKFEKIFNYENDLDKSMTCKPFTLAVIYVIANYIELYRISHSTVLPSLTTVMQNIFLISGLITIMVEVVIFKFKDIKELNILLIRVTKAMAIWIIIDFLFRLTIICL